MPRLILGYAFVEYESAAVSVRIVESSHICAFSDTYHLLGCKGNY
jgi:hypothetical protein